MTEAQAPPSDPSIYVARAKVVVGLLAEDLGKALATRAVMESANEVIRGRGQLTGARAAAFSVIHRNLVSALAMDVARMYDFGGQPILKQDKASIPVLAGLLKIEGVRNVLIAEAAEWLEDLRNENSTTCAAALDEGHRIFESAWNDDMPRAARDRLKDLRNTRLAHNLYHREPARPFYADLFDLLDRARDFTAQTLLAIEGKERDFKERERLDRESAMPFWEGALW